MEIREFWIRDLQPTDRIRASQQKFYSGKNIEEIMAIEPIPQVIECEGRLLIMDGNNRLANLAYRRQCEKANVGIVNPNSFDFIGYQLLEEAEKLRQEQIFCPYSLLDNSILKLDIMDLQPTNTIKPSSQRYLEELSLEELFQLEPLPEVAFIDGQNLLIDGNNRAVQYLKRGMNGFNARIRRPLQEEIIGLKNIVREFNRQGIYTPKGFT